VVNGTQLTNGDIYVFRLKTKLQAADTAFTRYQIEKAGPLPEGQTQIVICETQDLPANWLVTAQKIAGANYTLPWAIYPAS
jgi:hypothetical protein